MSPRGSVDKETALFAAGGLSRVVAQVVPIFHAQFSLIAAGVGIGLQLASFTRFACPGLSFVPVLDAPPMRLGLVWRRDDERELLHIFLDTARQAAQRLELEYGVDMHALTGGEVRGRQPPGPSIWAPAHV